MAKPDSQQSDSVECVTIECGRRATHYLTCEGEGSYPYCDICAGTLLRAGETDTRRPIDRPDAPQHSKRARLSPPAEEFHEATGGWETWTVQLERKNGSKGRERERRSVEARSEDEAIGVALRQAGLHDGWEVCGWWPISR